MLQERGVTAADTKRFIQWLFFNLYVGNHDSHAKNLAIYYTAERDVRLAPFYDMLSTSMYSGLSRKFAFRIGGENTPSNIHQDQIKQMAESWGAKPKYILTVGEDLCDHLLARLQDVSEAIDATASAGSEKTMIERLHQHIFSNTRKFQNRLFTKQR